MSSVPGGKFGAPIVVEGDPWREILRASDELDVDLIVMGTINIMGSNGCSERWPRRP